MALKRRVAKDVDRLPHEQREQEVEVGLVSLMDAKTHVFCPASPIDSRLISSRLSSAETSLTDSGFSRTLHEMMMLLRVLPAAVLNAL